MKKLSVLAIVAVLFAGMYSCDSRKSVKLVTDMDTISYLIGGINGWGMRQNMKSFPGGDKGIDLDILLEGFTNGSVKRDSVFLGKTTDEVQAYLQAAFTRLQNQESEKTAEEGKKFLEGNKGKSGVITTESGLQYKVLTEGKGDKPGPEDTVLVHYTGKFLNGEVFDSSIQRGEPIKFPVNGVIQGWSEGVQLMPAGSKYQMWIPSELGYGAQGNQVIKPNSTLEFEVELIEVLKKKSK
jgi:FKBP-type peptidyl-prolyl cis-trans isomerase FkpA/FKBP-type peptidyl-prolyl cis-trans isomerase FklB